MEPSPESKNAWARARDRYVEDLNEDERLLYRNATLENIFYGASAAERGHQASSTSRVWMAKLQPFLDAVGQYGQALDVFANTYPLALSPLWGSLRVLFHLVGEYNKYFEKLIGMFAQIGDVLPQFRDYERLFGNHERLVHRLSVVYEDILKFCTEVKAVFKKSRHSTATSFKMALKSTWKPFEKQFGERIRSFREHKKNIEREAGLSHMIEEAEARNAANENFMQLQKEKEESRRARIQALLSPVNHRQKYRKLQRVRHNGTGQWLLSEETYVEWKSSLQSSFLCCHGIPGCGKSTLVSIVIDDLLEFSGVGGANILYYFYDFTDQRTLQMRQMVGSLLKQILQQGYTNPKTKNDIIFSCDDGIDFPTEEELTDILHRALQCSDFFIIIDGLDECERVSRRSLIKFLKHLPQVSNSSVIKVLLTCRDEDPILQSLSQYQRIQVSAATLTSDITSYVKTSVEQRIESGELKISNPALEQEIIAELIAKAQGMFLWVFYQLNELCECASDASLRQTLSTLPQGLGETYERILTKIMQNCNNSVLAQKILRWTASAKRPLHVTEMQEAVAFDDRDTRWAAEKIPDADRMLATCRSLVVRDEGDETVRFAHHTVQQYLVTNQSEMGPQMPMEYLNLGENYFSTSFKFSYNEAELDAAQTCLLYLSFGDFQTTLVHQPNIHFARNGILSAKGPGSIPSALGLGQPIFDVMTRVLGIRRTPRELDIDYVKYLHLQRMKKPPAFGDKYVFLNYIREYWPEHTRVFVSLENSHRTILSFKSLVEERILNFEFRPWGPNCHVGPYGCSFCSEHEASSQKLHLTSMFLWAAKVGHQAILRFMSDDYVAHEEETNEILLTACKYGQPAFIRDLVPLVPRLMFKTAVSQHTCLTAACNMGDPAVVHGLLSFSSFDFEFQGCKYLTIAIAQGSMAIVKMLLGAGAKCTIDPTSGQTPIHLAISRGQLEIMEILLHHSNLSVGDSTGATPLHLAAEYGHDTMVDLLLPKLPKHSNNHMKSFPVAINAEDKHGRTALIKAAMKGYSGIVRTLINNGADTLKQVNRGMIKTPQSYVESPYEILRTDGIAVIDNVIQSQPTAIHYAARFGHRDVVIELCRPLDDHHDMSPMIWAAVYNHPDVIEVLLSAGYTVENCHFSVFEEWISRGDVRKDPPDFAEFTPLHYAARYGSLQAAEKLLERGADVRSEYHKGFRALDLAFFADHKKVIKLLKAHGAGMEFEEAMRRAFENYREDTVKRLVECGVSLNASTESGRRLWISATTIQELRSLCLVMTVGAQHTRNIYDLCTMLSEFAGRIDSFRLKKLWVALRCEDQNTEKPLSKMFKDVIDIDQHRELFIIELEIELRRRGECLD